MKSQYNHEKSILFSILWLLLPALLAAARSQPVLRGRSFHPAFINHVPATRPMPTPATKPTLSRRETSHLTRLGGWSLTNVLRPEKVATKAKYGTTVTLPPPPLPQAATTILGDAASTQSTNTDTIIPTITNNCDDSNSNAMSLECAQILWNLSPEEMIKVQSLQASLAADVDLKDHPKNNLMELVRFIQEHNKGSVKELEQKFRAMVAWRRKHQVDQLLEEYHPPSLFRYFPAGVLEGADHEGDPVHLERTGAADCSGLLQRYGREEMIQQAIWLREVQSQGQWQQDYQRQQGHAVKHFTVIMDMKGLSMRNISPSLLSVGQEVSRIVQDYYPGYAKRLIVIRAPAIFQLAYNAMKPFIDASMKDKIIIASGTNYGQVLEQYMDVSILPPEIHPQGQGKAVEEFDTVWKGGKIPDHEEPPRILHAATAPPPATPEDYGPEATKTIALEPVVSTQDHLAAKVVAAMPVQPPPKAVVIPPPPYYISPPKTIPTMAAKRRTTKRRMNQWLNQFTDSFTDLDGGYFGHPLAV